MGTTSACAENTALDEEKTLLGWNYLRVRGEYQNPLHDSEGEYGTTSACAENTLRMIGVMFWKRNYLRVRGEYTDFPHKINRQCELPPRARRIRQKDTERKDHHGTTSACAENTSGI